MRALVAGGSGMLGAELVARAPATVDAIARDRDRIDISDADSVAATLDETRPDVVLNAAAFTDVDAAETRGDDAFAVNARGVEVLGAACAGRGIRFVHYSTDYVFDGAVPLPRREDGDTNPLNVYGRSKLEGENALRRVHPRALVVRTQWLFGRNGRSFPRTMWQRASSRLATRVVDDQFGRPTYAVDLADATWRMIERGANGLFHVANAGVATWFDVARAVFEHAGVPELVLPCASDEFPRPAPRPRYSVLDTGKADECIGPLPAWRDALTRFLDLIERDSGPAGHSPART